jgi:hypothetical protein
MTEKRRIPMDKDYFTLMQFSAKWDPIPSMLCQNHTRQRLYGSDDFFDSALIKSNVLIMGCELNGKHDIFMAKGKGMFTLGGHDPFSSGGGSANGLGHLIPRLPINFK